jgi:hypothetical protein
MVGNFPQGGQKIFQCMETYLLQHPSYSFRPGCTINASFPYRKKIIRNASKGEKPNLKPYHPYGYRNLYNKSISEQNSSLFMNGMLLIVINEGTVESSGLRNLKIMSRNLNETVLS